jgi:pyruvate,water dikinase
VFALQWRLADGLRGNPTAAGEVVGTVCVVNSQRDLPKVDASSILVTRYFAPELAIGFRGAAIVTEAGGVCSHGTSIARERGIPVVTGVRGATRILKEGMRVRVDGRIGSVLPFTPKE